MKYSALIGNPTDHSVSHILYTELGQTAGLPDFYQHIRLNIASAELGQSLEALRQLHFVGLNVTLPYKLDIIPYLHQLDAGVDTIGAVNTIKLGETLTGYNTDWIGLAESIKQFGGRRPFTAAVIFGTGGAARAAIYACQQLGITEVVVFFRQAPSQNTRRLAAASRQLGITLKPYTEVGPSVAAADVIINATSTGMVGRPPLPFNLKQLADSSLQGKIFHDAVFNPLRTPLLRYFEAQGAVVIDGLWMMLHQGVKALSIWFERDLKFTADDLARIHQLLAKELQHV